MRALVLMAATLSACGSHPGVNVVGGAGQRAALDEGPLLPLTARDGVLTDGAGRQVILRGLQHHALQDVRYQGREVQPGDYPQIAAWGFSTLRVAISWSRVEPQRGQYDAGYLAEIRGVLDAAASAGLTVILEWHQDLWGRCSVDPTSKLAANANGAPDWTCPSGYQPGPAGFNELFDRLWVNQDGLRDAFVAAWGAVIRQVGDHPALLGYDLINEPAGSGASPDLEHDRVFPGYRALVPALRALGARGPIFLDAPGLRNEPPFAVAGEPFDALDPDLVYAPHLYSDWISLYLFEAPSGIADKRRDFDAAAAQAAAMRLPLWNGEWGVNLLVPSALDDLEAHVGLEEQHLIGSSYWSFSRAIAGQGDDSISGGQALLDEQRQVRGEVLDRLSRPYPIQTPGRLDRIAWDFHARALEVDLHIDGDPVAAPLVLFAPRRHLGTGFCLAVEGDGPWTWDERPARERVLLRFARAGAFRVRLFAC